MNNPSPDAAAPIVPSENRFAFFLIATCFGLWGMVNMMNDTLVPAVQKIFSIDNSSSALVQVVNYAAYALLALPAAILIKRFNYKTGVLVGLILLTIGVSSIVPAGISHVYTPILIAIAMMACGNWVLETSCNPYVLSMGHEASAVRRLNLAQTVNPIGCPGRPCHRQIPHPGQPQPRRGRGTETLDRGKGQGSPDP